MTELLTVPEVAERLRCGRRTVERLIAAGRIRANKVGRRTLVTSFEVEAFIAASRRQPAA
jgi:excisionase family DNA binding protein